MFALRFQAVKGVLLKAKPQSPQITLAGKLRRHSNCACLRLTLSQTYLKHTSLATRALPNSALDRAPVLPRMLHFQQSSSGDDLKCMQAQQICTIRCEKRKYSFMRKRYWNILPYLPSLLHSTILSYLSHLLALPVLSFLSLPWTC
jgi:hypothetical protein